MNARQDDNGLPESVIPLLRGAGWEPGRVVSVGPYIAAYRAEKIPWTNQVEEFLTEFGDLIIEYPTRFERKDVLEFCAQRAAQGIGPDGLKGFEELSGRQSLCPLGHYQSGTCLLLMAAKGDVLGGTDEVLTLIGNTGKNAIGNILTGAEPQVIGQFPTFEESFPTFIIRNDPAGSHGSASFEDFDVMINSLLVRHGFIRMPQKKSVSWAISEPQHTRGRPNVIFKLVDRPPTALEFGVRKSWLESQGLPASTIGDKEFRINRVEFVGSTVRKDQSGEEAVLQFLEKILVSST
jgi:hypothetical protein